MIIRIDQTSSTPIYLQIRNQIVEGIAREELVSGDGLPSIRQLASDLGINLHTVNKAYAVLRDEGYIVMRGRKGAFIADARAIGSPERQVADDERLAAELHRLALECRARGGSQARFVELACKQAKRAFADSPSPDSRNFPDRLS